MLKWSVQQDKVVGKLYYDGIFGWLALGITKEGGKKNGMNGGSIIMALPGDQYSPVTGLDLDGPASVHEYVIDPVGSAFRHWQTPVNLVNPSPPTTATTRSTSPKSYQVESTDCFTALSFETSSINDIPFNLTGTDNLMWAANTKDFYAGYHTARGRMTLEWSTGKLISLNGVATGDIHQDDGHHHDDVDNADVQSTSKASSLLNFSWVACLVAAALGYVI